MKDASVGKKRTFFFFYHITPAVSFDLYKFQVNQMYCGSALSLSMSFIVRILQHA